MMEVSQILVALQQQKVLIRVISWYGKILNDALSSEDCYETKQKSNGFLSERHVFKRRAIPPTFQEKLKPVIGGYLQMNCSFY